MVSLKNIFSGFFFLAFWGVGAFFAYQHQDKLHVLFSISPFFLALLVAFIIFGIACRGAINTVFYSQLGADLEIKQGLFLAVLNTLGNQLPFAGGFWAKGMILKRSFQLPLVQYLLATTSLLFFFTSIFGALGLISLACLVGQGYAELNVFIVLGFVFMLLPAVPLFFELHLCSVLPKRIQDYLKKAVSGWQIVKRSRRNLTYLALLQCGGVLLYSLRLYVLFAQLGKNVPFSACLVFASSAILSQFVAILPAGVGLREGIISGLGVLLGYDLDSCLLVVGYDRLLDLLVTAFFGGLILVYQKLT